MPDFEVVEESDWPPSEDERASEAPLTPDLRDPPSDEGVVVVPHG